VWKRVEDWYLQVESSKSSTCHTPKASSSDKEEEAHLSISIRFPRL
ncbi:hypothetical protein AVEN_273827-1, partial [Araneus ventricosus]